MSGPLGFDPGDDDRGQDGGDGREIPPPRHTPRQPVEVPRYGWFVGVVVVIFGIVLLVNAITSHGPGARGLAVGRTMPPFAAPLALGDVTGDVNFATKAHQGKAGKRPACSVRGPGILNVCVLYARGPVVLAITAPRGKQCTRELDAIERLRARHPGVQFAAVSIRGDRGALRDLVRGHGWGFPVAYDHDGVLANLYGVVDCPQTTFALPGGRVISTSLGALGQDVLDRRIRSLVAAARRRGWSPPAPR